ncbi:PAS domain-containing protein [Emticicia soli]|uniref:PAS domain-containing protein n=1 Tax=Emticicia soli TaxID=2027878 RepID=A0ABW5J271_9BACT
MLDVPAFVSAEDKKLAIPLLCWDIANPALEKRVHIHNDIQQLENLIVSHKWQLGINFKSLLIENHTLIVTNLLRQIIWTSQSFQTMTGYKSEDVVGLTLSFLQGPKTNLQTKMFIKEKLANFETLETRILNYRKNGESYWCSIKIFPIQNIQGAITHYIAVEKELN